MRTLNTKHFIWVIILLGIILRLAEYSANRSFWKDEAIVAIRITSTDLDDFFYVKEGALKKILSYPIGFVALEKLSLKLLGDNEKSLRLFPQICGILSLFVFAFLCRKLLAPRWMLVAVFLFAVSRDLVYYASELKPYSSDVLATLLLFVLFLKIISGPFNFKTAVSYGLLAGLSICFSFPAIIVLGGVSSYLFVQCASQKQWTKTTYVGIFSLIWALCLGVYFYFSLQHIMKDDYLQRVWQGNFMPFDGGIGHLIQWFIVTMKRLFSRFLQLPAGLAGLMFILGVISFFKHKRLGFSILLPPLVLTLLMSGFRMYPFDGRTITFLLPVVILIIIEGADILSQNQILKNKNFLQVLLIVFLLFFPINFSARQFLESHGPEDLKPVLQYIYHNRQEEDAIAVYDGSLEAYQYYAPHYGLSPQRVILNRKALENNNQARDVLNQLSGKQRVWVIFTHVKHDRDRNERKMILNILDRYGRRKDTYQVKVKPGSVIPNLENNISASCYLYDFSVTRNEPD